MKRLAVLSAVALALFTLLLVGCKTERLAAPYSSMLPECKDLEGIGHNQEDTNFGDEGLRFCKGKGHTLKMFAFQFDRQSGAQNHVTANRGLCDNPEVYLHCRELPSSHLATGVDDVVEVSLVDYALKDEEEDEGKDGAATVVIAFSKGTLAFEVEFTDERPVVARKEGKIVDIFELDYTQIALAEEIFGRIRDAIRSY